MKSKERINFMLSRRVFFIFLCVLGIAAISFLLILGNNVSVPSPPNPGAASSSPPRVFPKGASETNYTVLCVKKGNGKIKFTKTGSYVTCPTDYITVPVQLDPKLIKR